MIGRLCLIGLGLIGGSLARALRRGGLCSDFVAFGRSARRLQRAADLGVIDRWSTNMPEALQGSDVVVIAVPLGAMESVFTLMRGHLEPGSVVTDVGSTKRSVLNAAAAVFGEVPEWFVPGHPIAGTEKSGVQASFAELFEQRRVILTPLDHTRPEAVNRVRQMWRATGAEVLEMDVEHHDRVLAATSHLPHVLAYLLVDVLAGMEEEEEIFRFAAGGFRDFTRIASSDPVMWHDICLANRAPLLTILGHYQQGLAALSEAIGRGDSERILSVFRNAKTERDRFCG
jgi:prephenate dehydrogenase